MSEPEATDTAISYIDCWTSPPEVVAVHTDGTREALGPLYVRHQFTDPDLVKAFLVANGIDLRSLEDVATREHGAILVNTGSATAQAVRDGESWYAGLQVPGYHATMVIVNIPGEPFGAPEVATRAAQAVIDGRDLRRIYEVRTAPLSE